MNISGRLALITGASSGIGAATAKAIAKKGAKVILLARTQAHLEKISLEIADEDGESVFYSVDLADAKAVEKIAEQIKTEIGIPDILINCAGVGRWLFLEETSPEEAMKTMNVPYFAAFYIIRFFLPEMQKKNHGYIVIITSPASYIPFRGAPAYIASRAALKGLTDALRVDLYHTKINVSLVGFGGEVENTGYIQNNSGNRERIPKIAQYFPLIPLEKAVNAILLAIEKNKPEVMIPFLARFSILFYALFPRLLERLMSESRVAPSAR